MHLNRLRITLLIAAGGLLASAAPPLAWEVVVNNSVTVPGDTRAFNSYSQPALNANRLVVFRGRSKGGSTGQPAHGVWTRDMALGTPLVTVLDRTVAVPGPNNLNATFIEPPSIPRIDMYGSTVASRGIHMPVWKYMLPDGLTETRAGTTGIYANPFGALLSSANNLGTVPGYECFAVPGAPGVKFDVFPGAPAVSNGDTIVFKGNFTKDAVGRTGVYYRKLQADVGGGTGVVVRIADTSRLIPGSTVPFGSTAPPSAAVGKAVFAGFDNEENPTRGGIYTAPLTGQDPKLTAVVSIGTQVPGEAKGVGFNRLGEGVSYDGRFIAFWGAWGTATKTLVLQCPTDGNADLRAFCLAKYPEGFTTTVPMFQGIFVYDTTTRSLTTVAKTPTDFDDFVYWNFSGLVPGTGESDESGEPARWRSATFAAVSGKVDGSLEDRTYHVAFKGRKGTVYAGAYENVVDGLYLRMGPGVDRAILPLVRTGMDGTLIDPAAVDPLTLEHLPVTAMGLERDGFRGNSLAITVTMGTEAAGWAGVYLTRIVDVEDDED